ncbi:hypothetical protein [Streptomyces sp. 7-21]|jgi:hypothetical protein|uniref:hypothetical protein n=1 Tax=Streptomyces sp. 7-21 TaxID=2802283 RepID=UPI00191E4358|nr:hypothetical protein [Streptomyces sp. 7-21]MBL1066975.1 hypothetical protein [Streptomyces sp. 7-21]
MRTHALLAGPLALTAALALGPSAALAGAPVSTGGHHTAAGAVYAGQLLAAKAATAPYRDVARAESDGYQQTSPCTPEKGIHYLREVAQGPEELDVLRPNALVYDAGPDGTLVLHGIEYVSHTPATLFGQEFEQSPAVGYYTLHVWLWEPAPHDLFAADNPRLTCGG